MKSKSIYIVCCMLLVGIFNSCNRQKTEVEPGFYYWKTTPSYFTTDEIAHLYNTSSKHVYLKLFEVDVDPIFTNAPISKNNFYGLRNSIRHDTSNFTINIIPTVFIKNVVLLNISPRQIDSLADNVTFLINKRMKQVFYDEIQIDCDWTERTRDNYFLFLKSLKNKSKKKLSCTLRLYSFTYPKKAGVPPVDRVSLMCYNLLAPLSETNKNTILDVKELKKYLKKASPYPLQTDIALPVFGWYQWYQDDEFKSFLPIHSVPDYFIGDSIRPFWNRVRSDNEIGKNYLREGDLLKREVIEEKALNETLKLLKKYVKLGPKTRITLFHLDEKNLEMYNNEKINLLFTRFSE